MSTTQIPSHTASDIRRSPGRLPLDEHPRYRIIEALGRGGMGQVFLAEERESGRRVALKTLHATKDPEALLRFEHEARALARVDHPHIARFIRVGDAPFIPHFAMEFIAGESLDDLIREANLRGELIALPRIIDILVPIAEALAYCHAAGLVHRDIKPANIVLEETSLRPVLIDFGLARGRGLGDSIQSLTATGAAIGTPAAMSPEQLNPKVHGRPGPASDVWNFGVLLYRLLTLRPPFLGRNGYEVYKSILHDPTPDPREARPELPAALSALCRSLLAAEPGARPGMADLARRLRAIKKRTLRRRPLRARRPSPLRRLFIATILGLGLVLSGLGAYALLARPPLSVAIAALPETAPNTDFILRGRVSSPQARVRIGEAEVALEPDGRFAHPLSLKDGWNRIALVARLGEERVERAVLLTCDSRPPRLIFEGGAPFRRLDGELRGKIEDASEARLWIDGDPVPLDPVGRFAIPALNPDPDAPLALRFRVEDALGHREESRRIIAPNPLLDRERWARASPELQDQVLAEIEAKIRAPLRFVGWQDCQQDGLRYRIAGFEHEPSGVRFQLIPGGLVRPGVLDTQAELAAAREDREQAGLPAEAAFDEHIRALSEATPAAALRRVAPFFIGRAEVTRGQWKRLNPEETAGFAPGMYIDVRNYYLPELDGHPMGYLRRDHILKGLAPWPLLRLPREDEWEYAALAGSRDRYPWGRLFDGARARWPGRVRPGPWQDRIAAANAFGLVDAGGGYLELVADTVAGEDGAPRAIFKGSGLIAARVPIAPRLRTIYAVDVSLVTHGLRLAIGLEEALEAP